MIKRNTYLTKIHAVKNNEQIKIIMGVKRGGKTTLISQFIEELELAGIKKEQLIYLNFEHPDFGKVLDADQAWLHQLSETLDDGRKYYIFLDEVAQLDGLTIQVIEHLATKENIDLYLISSSSTFLPSLTASSLNCELFFIHVFPLSFKEFIVGFPVHHMVPSTKHYWNFYLRSSFPHVITLKTDRDRELYLSEVVDSLLVNDLMLHLSISNVYLLKYLIQFLIGYVGREISINGIATRLTCKRFPKIYPKMIDKYVQGLLGTFLFYKVNRYDIKEKQVISTSPKYYMADVGLHALSHRSSIKEDVFTVENIVFLELKKRGYEVFFGKIGDDQIDFVAKKDDFFEYYQVSHLPINPPLLTKKKRPIEKLRDGYPRFLLTLDQAGVRANHEGLKQLSIFEWLMQP